MTVRTLWHRRYVYALIELPNPVIFFFQAEDGIRYKLVTGVQTCALPIFLLDDKDVMGVLDRKTVDDAFDLKVQLRHVDEIFDRVFGAAAASTKAGSWKLGAGS